MIGVEIINIIETDVYLTLELNPPPSIGRPLALLPLFNSMNTCRFPYQLPCFGNVSALLSLLHSQKVVENQGYAQISGRAGKGNFNFCLFIFPYLNILARCHIFLNRSLLLGVES